MISRVVIIAYLAYSCKGIFDKKYTVQTSMLKRDLTIDKAIYNMTKDNFDFGLYMDYAWKYYEPEIYEHLDEYVDLRVTQNYYVWIKDE